VFLWSGRTAFVTQSGSVARGGANT